MTLAILNIGSGLTASVPLLGPITPRDRAELQFAMIVADVAPEAWKAYRLGSLAGALQGRQTVFEVRPATGPTQDQMKALERANRRLSRATNGDERERALKAQAAALADIERYQNAVYLDTRRAELTNLEALRGGTVYTEERVIDDPVLKDGAQVYKKGKPVTVRRKIANVRVDRDGLEVLCREPKGPDGKPLPPVLNPIQYAAGRRYREAFERANEQRALKAVDPGKVGGSSSMSLTIGDLATAHANANRGERLAAFDMAVRSALEHDPAIHCQSAVLILRAVAGEGKTIREAVGGGRANERAQRHLLAALDALADHLGMQ